jgi:hypothetical protein
VDLTDRGFISVGNHLRTTADHVWAAGDVAGTPQFTHASWNDFRILKANFDHGDAVTTGRIVPYTVFITPELARVGITEAGQTRGWSRFPNRGRDIDWFHGGGAAVVLDAVAGVELFDDLAEAGVGEGIGEEDEAAQECKDCRAETH